MNRKWTALCVALFIMATASAQTLFTYGNYSADEKDFLRAFNKNNTASTTNRRQAMKDYLDLYIASRLKIREAYNRGYDTLTQIQNEIQNLRSQIIENYINDPKVADRMLMEAFTRSQKDIHVAHIYISFKDAYGVMDTAAAERLANQVYDKLKKGADFSSLATQYSSDPAAKINHGEIGYITVYTLPYAFENVIYNTAPGKFSTPYKSKIGFHIFKNLGERRAIGRMKAAQVLLAFPPQSDEATRHSISLLADSIYKALASGADIAPLSKKYSNDYVSAASNGVIPDFTVGEYDPVFEKTFLSLPKNGISKPFMTNHGFHIIKRIGVVPVSTDPKNKPALEELRARMAQSDRIAVAREQLAEQVLGKTPVKRFPFADKDLWIFTDSMLNYQPKLAPTAITSQSKLFTIGSRTVTAEDWIAYAQVWRFKPNGGGQKPYPQLWNEFIHNQAENYYRDHLEDYNEDFRHQMDEFRDGNLFFEIMQNEVWSKAQNDSAALLDYYNHHATSYRWKQSADAVIFFCADVSTAKLLYDQLKKNPSAWKKSAEELGEKVVADSSRYEYEQIPHFSIAEIKSNTITSQVVNKTDGTVSFAFVLRTYPANMQRNFHDAKGLVISDYQSELEKNWVSELKKKYPVKLNEAEWDKISRQ
jgi:peptidyl-prolyl cis-trans isomerase SurA